MAGPAGPTLVPNLAPKWLKQTFDEADKNGDGSLSIGEVLQLLHKLNAELCRREYTKRKPTETACSKVLHYIKENLDKPIRLEQLAAMVHLDKSYFVRLFRETYGQTPIQFLINLRMEHACDLITYTDLPMGQIAQRCGYPSPSHFSAEYKKHYGVTPATHRTKQE